MGFTASFERISQSQILKQRLNMLAAKAVYVGIPASSANDRSKKLLSMAGTLTGKSTTSRKRKGILERAADRKITNAELLFIFSKGSPIRNQPPRPVLEPAIEADGNRQAIAAELAAATKATMDGETGEATRRLKRAGVVGANAARGWFTDVRNGWAQNAPSTIRAKLEKMRSGKKQNQAFAILDAAQTGARMPQVGQNPLLDSINTPGVDTGAMRAAITWVLKNDTTTTNSEPAPKKTTGPSNTGGMDTGAAPTAQAGANEILGEAVEGIEAAGEGLAEGGAMLL
jgi:hypothetical protein